MVPAIFLGRFLNHRMKREAFVKYVYWGLVVVGLILLIEAVRGVSA